MERNKNNNIAFELFRSPAGRSSLIIMVLSLLTLMSFNRLFWLVIIVTIGIEAYIFILILIAGRRAQLLRQFISFMFVFGAALFIRLFVCSIYLVPSASMENEIFAGDYILADKLTYGPKLPQSPYHIPYLNLLFSNKNLTKADSNSWGYHRLSGYGSIKRNDVIIFNRPDSGNLILIKRCVGLPGEIIKLKYSKLFVDNHQLTDVPTVQHHYRIWLNDLDKFFMCSNSHSLKPLLNTSDLDSWVDCGLDASQLTWLKTQRFVDSICISKSEKLNSLVFNDIAQRNWNFRNLGPVIIPKRGMTLAVTRQNYLLYKLLIENYEGNKTFMLNGNFYLNGHQSANYTFSLNYYFFIGDNRDNSIDSRVWGLVPENCIDGKAKLVLFTNDLFKSLSFKRFFMSF